jgi:inner membrane protein
MDNITHSLVGSAVAQVAYPSEYSPGDRRVFQTLGVLAANLPDIDLVYTGITPAPLGYLLHHRGHTHTLAGMLGLGLAVMLFCRFVPRVRRLAPPQRARLWVVVWLNLVGHVSLDALNSYGVHPFYPLDSTWYYGDAIFIFEPWVWTILAVPVIRNAGTRLPRLLTASIVGVLLLAVATLGVVPLAVVVLIVSTGGALFLAAAYVTPRIAAAVALAAAAGFIAGMIGLSRVARLESVAAAGGAPGRRIVDTIVTPDPAVPVCWGVILVLQEGSAELVLRRGTLSLIPARYPPQNCASGRLTGATAAMPRNGGLVWVDEIRQPLAALRDLRDRDCWVRAWLQFGRAPIVRDGAIRDFRFDIGTRRNFTVMSAGHDPAAGCPANVPGWTTPRGDVLGIP